MCAEMPGKCHSVYAPRKAQHRFAIVHKMRQLRSGLPGRCDRQGFFVHQIKAKEDLKEEINTKTQGQKVKTVE